LPDDALTTLYRRFGPVIYGRCRRLLMDQAAAEDATQETFLRVYRHIERAPDVTEALAWIYRIATNYCLNEIRDRRARPQPHEILPERGSVSVDATFEERFVDQDLVRRLIARSGPKLRTVAWLYHMDGLEQDAVASIMGISRRTVVSRLAAFAAGARQFLRRTQQ
jgi:RNA polymerase sigma-70 factor (ECF subfamily)